MTRNPGSRWEEDTGQSDREDRVNAAALRGSEPGPCRVIDGHSEVSMYGGHPWAWRRWAEYEDRWPLVEGLGYPQASGGLDTHGLFRDRLRNLRGESQLFRGGTSELAS